MKYLLFTIFIFCFPMTMLCQWDFEADSLYVVWGSKNYSGKKDCSARTRLRANDTSLTIEVEVIDDHLIFNDDPLNSDHIEIWLAIPPESTYGELASPNDARSYYTDKTSSLYVCEDSNKIKDPTFKKATVFFGMVHLGVLPRSNQAILYDKEAYLFLSEQLGIEIPNYSKFVKVESKILESGYRVKIEIPVCAIGFITRTGLEALNFAINIIDTDTKGKQETMLSTSPVFKWGERGTFTRVDFGPGLSTKLNDIYIEFGSPSSAWYHKSTTGMKLWESLSKIFLYTSNGWIPVECQFGESNGQDQVEESNDEQTSKSHLTKCRFKKGILNIRQDKLGNNQLYHLSATGGDYLIINNDYICPEDEIVTSFLLPDSSVGLLTTQCDISGKYQKNQTSQLFLVCHSVKTIIAEFQDYDTVAINISNVLKVKATEWDQSKMYWDSDNEENFAWSNLISWENAGKSIMIDLGNNKKVRVFWNEHGQNIQFNK